MTTMHQMLKQVRPAGHGPAGNGRGRRAAALASSSLAGVLALGLLGGAATPALGEPVQGSQVQGSQVQGSLSQDGIEAEALGPVATGPVAEAAAVTAAAVKAAVEEQLAAQPTAEEAVRLEPVERAMSGEGVAEGADGGAFAALRGRTPTYLTRQDAALRALRHNLTIASTGLEPSKAAEALREAEALFDPRLSLGVSYSQSETHARSRLGLVRRKAFGPVGGTTIYRVATRGEPGVTSPAVPIPPGNANPALEDILFRWVIGANPVPTQIVASADDTKGPAKSLSYTVNLQQQLPWGPVLTLGAVTSQRWLYSENDHPYYSGMFAGNLSAQLAGPVPFSAGFGEYAPAETQIRLAQLSRKQTDFLTRETVNQVLLAADAAYWRVVAALEVMRAAQANLDATLGLADRAQRLFDLQRATAMDKAQADAQVARARVQLEDARAGYVEASNALGQILSDTPDGVVREAFLPYGYDEDFRVETWDKVSEADALTKAKDNRPLLFLNQAQVETAEFSEKVAENNTRPNVDFTLGANLGQDNSQYGFRTPVQAYGNIGRPDSVRLNGGLTWTQGWGNRGPEAAHTAAQLATRSARIGSDMGENAVRREVGDAIAALASARARVKQARIEVERLETALASLDRRAEIGADVTRYEVLDTTRRLYGARQSLVGAQTDLKVAEARLMAAQGTLSTDYAQVTAAGELERKRVAALQGSGLLAYFAPPRLGGDGEQKAARSNEQ